MKRTIFALLFVFSVIAAFASTPQPEYMPYCETPAQIAPTQLLSANLTPAPLVWNGKDYAVVWDMGTATDGIYFQRYYADGTAASSAVRILSPYSVFSPIALVWNGSGYAIAYRAYTGSYQTVFFCRLDASGNPLSSPIEVSTHHAGMMDSMSEPSLAWSGSGYAVAWGDTRSGLPQIYATTLDQTGHVDYQDIYLSPTTSVQYDPDIAWLPGSNYYQAVWRDYRSGTHNEIYGIQINPDDGTVIYQSKIISGSGSSWNPTITAGPNTRGLCWEDDRDGQNEVYFCLLTMFGGEMGNEYRLTNSAYNKYEHVCVWNGAEFGVFYWNRIASMSLDGIYFQRVSAMGAAVGGNVLVSQTGSMTTPMAAFANHGYLYTSMGDGNYIQPLGCYTAVAPGCPSNIIAYGVSGSTATIAWQAAIDNFTDIAYYGVYRNNAEIAKTSSTYYTDTGLGLNTTYNYTVRAVNAAQIMNDQNNCGPTQSQTVYVKTNSSFTLMLDKSSDPDAHLYWNDGGMNSYNIFRGTNPQVMSLIGTTSGQSTDDNNVLLDTNTYFYTVDDPGQ